MNLQRDVAGDQGQALNCLESNLFDLVIEHVHLERTQPRQKLQRAKNVIGFISPPELAECVWR